MSHPFFSCVCELFVVSPPVSISTILFICENITAARRTGARKQSNIICILLFIFLFYHSHLPLRLDRGFLFYDLSHALGKPEYIDCGSITVLNNIERLVQIQADVPLSVVAKPADLI